MDTAKGDLSLGHKLEHEIVLMLTVDLVRFRTA